MPIEEFIGGSVSFEGALVRVNVGCVRALD